MVPQPQRLHGVVQYVSTEWHLVAALQCGVLLPAQAAASAEHCQQRHHISQHYHIQETTISQCQGNELV